MDKVKKKGALYLMYLDDTDDVPINHLRASERVCVPTKRGDIGGRYSEVLNACVRAGLLG